MDRVLQCDCGFEARAADEDGLVAVVMRHAQDTHGMTLSHDEALVLAFRAELGASLWPATPHQTPARKRREEQ